MKDLNLSPEERIKLTKLLSRCRTGKEIDQVCELFNKSKSNSVWEFCETLIFKVDVLNIPTHLLYKKYLKYCQKNKIIYPESHIYFSKLVIRFFDCTTRQKRIDGVKYRIFTVK